MKKGGGKCRYAENSYLLAGSVVNNVTKFNKIANISKNSRRIPNIDKKEVKMMWHNFKMIPAIVQS